MEVKVKIMPSNFFKHLACLALDHSLYLSEWHMFWELLNEILFVLCEKYMKVQFIQNQS